MQINAEQSKAKQWKAKQTNANQFKTMQSTAKQCKALQSKCEFTHVSLVILWLYLCGQRLSPIAIKQL